jgi:hypothetical protein
MTRKESNQMKGKEKNIVLGGRLIKLMEFGKREFW